MPNLRTVEKPDELLARAYSTARSSGLFEKLSTICRTFGAQSAPHLYRLVHGDLCLYLDASDGSLSVYSGEEIVCSTSEGGELFLYGIWVTYIEVLYQAITAKTCV